MRNGDLLNIGIFSVLTGLSIPALRHYDDVGLLEPASVNRSTGYRQYRLDQVRTARLIRSLRAVDLPIDSIREILAGDESAVRRVLVAHRGLIAERGRALAANVTTLDDYIENGVRMASSTTSRICEINLGVNDLDVARTFYEAVFMVEFTEEQHGDGPLHPPSDVEGMPRTSTIADPSGNLVNLYQNA